jgi:D-alanyl-lipoteichoic acid acyltransferase DltB (MBOAT superfamily)
LFQKKQLFSKKKFRKNMGEIIETAIICSVITLFGLSLGFLFIKMQDS